MRVILNRPVNTRAFNGVPGQPIAEVELVDGCTFNQFRDALRTGIAGPEPKTPVAASVAPAQEMTPSQEVPVVEEPGEVEDE